MCFYAMRGIVSALAIGFLVVLGACNQNVQPDQTADAAAKSQPAQATETAAGITWTMPAEWTAEGPRPMRIATYSVPAAAGDQESGECAVYFFGTGEGGDVEANVARWQSQFEEPDGETPELTRQQTEINGLSVTTVSVEGSYLASMGPMVQSGAVKKPGYRMLGAIIKAPEGNVFIKFTGPEKTVAAAETQFKALIESVRK